MLKIHTMPVGMLQTNCYLLRQEDRKDCVVVDPGDNARTILAYLEQEDLTVAAILLTHGHFDHDGAVKDLALEFDCPVYMNKKELILPLDVHVYDQATALGLTSRRQKDIVTAREITDSFKEIWPDDPCKGDFALFGYGVTHQQ